MSAAKHTPSQDIDPRGIRRKQTRVIVDQSGGTTLVQFECGHIGEMAHHFTYKVGDVRFCFKCGKEAKACNSHDALVAALFDLVRYHEDGDYAELLAAKARAATDGNVSALEALCATANAALKAAKGTE